ncbi:MAG TPA: hypothetical protein VD837_11755 [Terriglobales bacterium]|nr:hypothetical protein [Terriglobales bacterium]
MFSKTLNVGEGWGIPPDCLTLIYNQLAMQKTLVILMISLAAVVGCNKKPSTPTGDALQQKLQQLSGNDATDCGRLKSLEPEQMKKASDCAMQASGRKQPFYVAYELPGLTVAVAGNSEGKNFALNAQQPENAQAGAAPEIRTEACPSELRVAQSGRVTCFAPGSFGMNSAGGNPHGGMSMPPATGENPHGGTMAMPRSGMPNPHTPTKPDGTEKPR